LGVGDQVSQRRLFGSLAGERVGEARDRRVGDLRYFGPLGWTPAEWRVVQMSIV
jgi:hypothetical protein